MKIKEKIFLFVILFLAIFLRFYQIDSIPPSLTWDEAAWGYNAYTLGIDGRDEFGRFLPVDYIESFGDFKPPVYAYITIIPVKLFGLNEFAVRFPSAFFGVFTILITYFLVKELFRRSESKHVEKLALISAFMLTISPWHINLSRAAFEANVASFFIVAGVWFFMVGIRKKLIFFILSVVSFILSAYTFNSARVVAPLLFLVLTFAFRNEVFRQKLNMLIAGVLGLIIIIPIVPFLLSPQAGLRFKEVNIFTDINVVKTANQEIENDKNNPLSKIIHNRRIAYAREYIKHYFDNLNPNFLFIKGDGNPKFSTQDVGQLYLWELPFFILGILFLFRRKEGYWWLLPTWLLIGIIPAATARETPHALRIETTLPVFQVFTAYGMIQFLQMVSGVKFKALKIKASFLFVGIVAFTLFFNVLYYLHGYYAHYSKTFSGEWQYGYKESIDFVKSVQHEYQQINITSKLGRPYAYYAFYLQTQPNEFRKSAIVHRNAFGFVNVEGFGKYRFNDSVNKIKNPSRKVLYIDVAGRLPSKAQLLKTFYLLNGEPALIAYRFSI